MKCFFLSADHDLPAWQRAQESFLKHAPAHWELDFFGLSSGSDLAQAWRDLGKAQQAAGEPFMVVTAGVRFGPNSFETFDNSLAHLNKSGGFDLLFADLRFLQAGAMADLFVLRRQLVAQGRTRLIDPRPLGFEAPAACLIHPRAVPYIGAGTGVTTIAELIDKALCQPARDGGLMARFIFPFATTLSSEEDGHVPRDAETRASMIGDIYRRIVWRDGDCEGELAPLAQISKGLSTEAKAILWAAMAD
jgi:hypothetical protein